MPVAVSYPGVYVQELASGSAAIAPVPTAIALFVGTADLGELVPSVADPSKFDTVPVRIQSAAAFDATFGTTDSGNGELADQVHQFFLNGGSDCYVCRVANGAKSAQITLRNAGGTEDSLTFTALDPGLLGNNLRIEIDYDTSEPERTFNAKIYRRVFKADGSSVVADVETYKGLSMDPSAFNFAPTVIGNRSVLVGAKAPAAPAAVNSFSLGGLLLSKGADPAATNDFNGALPTGAAQVTFALAVGNNAPVIVTVPTGATTVAGLETDWNSAISAALTGAGIPDTVTFQVSSDETVGNGGTGNFRTFGLFCASSPIRVTDGNPGTNATGGLMLGAAAGGIESDAFAEQRPAPTGLFAQIGAIDPGGVKSWAALRKLAEVVRNKVTQLTATDGTTSTSAVITLSGGAKPLITVGTNNNFLNLRDSIDIIAAQFNQTSGASWTAKRQGYRLVLTPNYVTDNTGASGNVTTATVATPDSWKTMGNVAAYTLGTQPAVPGSYQTGAVGGLNSALPLTLENYTDAFDVIDREVDLFNLMILPRTDPGQTDAFRQALWGNASAFCAKRRAMLLVDPPSTWTTIDKAAGGIDSLRLGVTTSNAAAYWPRVALADGTATGKIIDPSGTVAGVYSRIDANRGVWKAPAGLEATMRGVIGVERKMTDPDNGQINPKALNAIRLFPAGIVAWGARTLVGFDDTADVDDKYVPVRRTAMFIEESLYRGLAFAVFEPNAEPLWSRIRLACNTFMNGLFRQGAFAASKASDAFFVYCDANTTTAGDIQLGIVNVIVGFKPLEPAEFVVLTITQMAGQTQI